MTVTKIISGGQTGADRAGLEAARELGIPTGGYIVKGWRTERGAEPLLAEFGLVETDSTSYAYRTELNVRESDGTVIFGRINSSGSQLTYRLCQAYHKPVVCNPTGSELQAWIERYDISVLNVAGNRESVNPGIGESVKELLILALGETTNES